MSLIKLDDDTYLGVFPVGDELHQLEIGLQAVQAFAISRGPPAPRSKRLDTRAGLNGMLLSPFSCEIR